MRTIIFMCSLLFLLSGCSSLSGDVEGVRTITDSGISSFQSKVKLADPKKEKAVGTEYTIILGKEYEDFTLSVKFDNDKPVVRVTAHGVKSFEGQSSAVAALTKIRAEITDQNKTVTEAAMKSVDAALKVLGQVP